MWHCAATSTLGKQYKIIIILRKTLDYDYEQDEIYPDWVAGMFMIFPSHHYKKRVIFLFIN